MLINKLKERTWSIQNLIFTNRGKSVKEINFNRLIYTYISKCILNCPVEQPTKSKLHYTYGLEIKEEDMFDLGDIMLQKEVKENEKSIDIEDENTREKNEDGDIEDDIEMSKTLFC